MLDPERTAQIRESVLTTFQMYTDDSPETILNRVEKRCGFSINALALDRIDTLCEAVQAELSLLTDAWKAKFVSGIMKKLLRKKFQIG